MARDMAAILLMLGALSPALAQDRLVWKLHAAEAFTLERVFVQKQTIDVKGNQFTQDSTTTWVNKIVVKEVREKDILLEMTLASVVQKRSGKGPAAEEKGLLDKLAGSKFGVAMSPTGHVLRFEGYDDVIKKLVDNKPERAKTLRFLLPEASLRDGLEEVLGFLPEQPVQSGDRWLRKAHEPMPPFGSFLTTFAYRLDGVKDGQARIGYDIKMAYELPDRENPLLQVVKGELKADSGSGEISFTPTASCLASGKRRVNIRGTLVVEALGNQTKLEFTSENSLRWRLVRDAPKVK